MSLAWSHSQILYDEIARSTLALLSSSLSSPLSTAIYPCQCRRLGIARLRARYYAIIPGIYFILAHYTCGRMWKTSPCFCAATLYLVWWGGVWRELSSVGISPGTPSTRVSDSVAQRNAQTRMAHGTVIFHYRVNAWALKEGAIKNNRVEHKRRRSGVLCVRECLLCTRHCNNIIFFVCARMVRSPFRISPRRSKSTRCSASCAPIRIPYRRTSIAMRRLACGMGCPTSRLPGAAKSASIRRMCWTWTANM